MSATLDTTTPLSACAPTLGRADLEEQLRRDGYVVVDAVDPAALAGLQEAWAASFAGERHGMRPARRERGSPI